MSKKYTLAAQKRDRAGKGVARALRRENRVPAVIYGDNKPPVLISLEDNQVRLEHMKGHMKTNLCELKIENETILTLVRDIQRHAATEKIESIDFMRVSPKTTIHVKVPVHFINQEKSPGMKAKGVLTVMAHEVELICNASDIPEALEVDLSEAEIGTHLHLTDIKLPKGAATPKVARDIAIASILEPKVFVEEETDAAAAPAAAAAAPAADAKKGDAKAADAKKPEAKK
jgi:large subunit ribosomal protein L25